MDSHDELPPPPPAEAAQPEPPVPKRPPRGRVVSSPPEVRLEPGELVDGKYRINRLLGKGGMGVVFEAEHIHVGRRVALKVLRAAADSEQVERFKREARAASQVESHHIVQVFDLGRLPDGAPYMVMEFLSGETLGQRLARSKRLTPLELAPITLQILDALGAAHRAGIVHRDLKPDNVFLVGEPGGLSPLVKVLDFGISKFQEESAELTQSGMVLGTPQYMSPEQARGAKYADARTDLYALGAILYRCLSGRTPYTPGDFGEVLTKVLTEQPAPVEQIIPDLDPGFSSLVTRAMERKSTDRFNDAGEFERELRAWSEAHAVSLPPPDQRTGSTASSWSSGRVGPRRTGGTVLIAFTAVIFVGAVTLGVFFASTWRSSLTPLADPSSAAPPDSGRAAEPAGAVEAVAAAAASARPPPSASEREPSEAAPAAAASTNVAQPPVRREATSPRPAGPSQGKRDEAEGPPGRASDGRGVITF